jgi:hypothetical protein
MIIKHKLYKIALVSIAMALMLVSTAGAFPFCGCGCGDHSWDHSCNDKSSDSSDKCIVCPGCPGCPACNCPTCPACNCPTCAAPALNINKTGSITGFDANNNPIITYNYTLTNIGNVGLSGIVIYDNKTSPTGMPVTTITTLAPGANVTVNANYTCCSVDENLGSVTNSAYATAIGNLINIISNTVSTTVSCPVVT